MRLVWFLATLLVVATTAAIKKQPTENRNEKLRYDNYTVYKLKINSRPQLAIMEFFQAKHHKYRIWKDYDSTTKEIHVMVNPNEDSNFRQVLKFNGLESTLLINNVQELIDEEASFSKGKSTDDQFDWTRYYELHEIERWLDDILAAYPNVTEGFVIGQSYEKRNVRGIKISYKAENPGIFIESNIHAREWITSATTTWFINELLTSTNEDVRYLAENFDWLIIPIVNVDGFVYSHEKDRLWRKTRQPISSSACVGTDANRNFDVYWLQNNGASSNPCMETFAGTKPFSEPEVDALAKYLTSNKGKINIYLSFHSYGQLLLSPYGHSDTEFPSNYNDMQVISKACRDAVAALPYGTEYIYGSTASVLYNATGSSLDWVYSILDVKLGFTFEFRDDGHYGFILPPEQILPNCEEAMAGLIALVKTAKNLNYV